MQQLGNQIEAEMQTNTRVYVLRPQMCVLECDNCKHESKFTIFDCKQYVCYHCL